MVVVLSWPVLPSDPACDCPPSIGSDLPVDLTAAFGCSKSAIETAKDAMFLNTAVDRDLDRLGSMFLVPRPQPIGPNDAIYRKLIQLLAFSPKQVIKIVYDLLGVLFGTQQDIIDGGGEPWKIFEVFVNEIIIEIPLSLTTSGLANATYLHGLGNDGNGFTTGVVTTFFVFGDDFTKAASNFVGLNLTVDIAGTLTNFPIVSLTYDSTTKKNTFTITGALPATTSGLSWRVLIPASVSFIGDYLISSPSVAESTVDSNIVVLFGEGLIDVFNDFMTNIVKASGIKVRIERI